MKIPAMNNDIPGEPTKKRNFPSEGEEQPEQEQDPPED
jgi:hypothetical protein